MQSGLCTVEGPHVVGQEHIHDLFRMDIERNTASGGIARIVDPHVNPAKFIDGPTR